jgi:PilZ domain
MQQTSEQTSGQRRPQDQRDSPRVPFRFLARCAVDGEPFEETRGDLSTGGVFWGTNHQPHGQDVEVRVVLPGEHHEIHARGQIVARRESGIHIRFTTLGTDDELAIARYIDEVGIGWE